PAVSWATYLGVGNQNQGTGIAVDSSGNAYVVGWTDGNFPVLNATQSTFGGNLDAFVAKYTSAGARVWATYLGGSGYDKGAGIAVDSSGNAYVTGITAGVGGGTVGFPLLNAAQSSFGGGTFDAFVAKLTSSGALVWSTYLGGSGDDSGNGIAVDSNGNAYVTGQTASTNFPVLNAAQSSFHGRSDAFGAKYTSDGTKSWATYLGGAGDDPGNGIAVDSSGNAYVTGTTNSADFPVLNADQSVAVGSSDAFMVKYTSAGAVVWATFLGGGGN